MRIPFNLIAGKEKIPFSLPTIWQDVTAREYKAILDLPPGSDESDLLALVTGIPKDTWMKSNSVAVYTVAKTNLAFIFEEMPDVTTFDHIVKYKDRVFPVMNDLGNLSIGQWKDIEKMCLMPLEEVQRSGKPTDAIPYGVLLCAIYLQPMFDLTVHEKILGQAKDYNYSRAVEISEELMDMPIIDSLRLQRFFFLRTEEYAKALNLTKLN